MALDIVGPANAPNAVTVRPADTRTFGAADTWVQDCSSPSANDGTKVQAGFVNALIGQFRNLIRGNGQTAAAADIVTPLNSDDSMVLKALQHMIQRGMVNYAADTGTADAMVVTLSPPLAEYKVGTAPIRVKKSANANTTTTPTINVNGLGAVTILRLDGAALEAGELAASGFFSVAFDGTNFRKVSVDREATKAEAEAGALASPFISPLTLFQRRTPFFFATGSSPQGIPSGADTKVTNIGSVGASYFNSGSGFASAAFTCGAKDAGAWLFAGYAALELLTASAGGNDYRASIATNGGTGAFMTTYINPSDTYGIVVTTPIKVLSGDVIDLRVFQNTSATRNVVSTQLFGLRLSGAV
jgi:hypothetical protein